MPSPVGHALGGVLFGWLIDGGPRVASSGSPSVAGLAARVSATVRDPRTLAFLLLGPLADIDFLFGIHSRQTHSIGAALIVLAVAWAWQVHRRRRAANPGSTAAATPLRFAIAAACAYGSHVLFDWMGNDTTPPIGIMALWPFSEGFYQSQLYVFEAISRRYALPGFWAHNLYAVAREIVILAPVVAALWWWRTRPRRD